MPIQIIPAAKTFGGEFGRAIGGGLGAGLSQGLEEGREEKNKLIQQKQLEQQDKQRSETLQRLTGMDLSGLDPQTQKTVVSEMLKQQGKESILGQKQSFLNKILNKQTSGNDINQESQLPQSEQDNDLSGLSDEDIIQAENMGLKGLREAKNAQITKKTKEEQQKRGEFESDRAFHSKISEPILKAAESTVREAPIKKGLIDQQRRDIASGDTSGIFPFLVDKLGLESFRDPASSRFKTASKERFVASVHELGSSGARANQFIEQQLVAAQAALGRDPEANLSVLDLEEFINDAKTKRSELELEMAEQDIEKLGYAKNDISRRADKLMKPYMEQRQDEMAYDIRKRHEDQMDDQKLTQEIVSKKVTPDTPLTIRAARILMIKNNDDEKAAAAEAKRLGYKIPSDQTYMRQK
jgi:hypothetical protein